MDSGNDLPRVRVKGAGGKTAVVRVVEETEDTYYVISEAEYQNAIHGGLEVRPRLGFPKHDATEFGG